MPGLLRRSDREESSAPSARPATENAAFRLAAPRLLNIPGAGRACVSDCPGDNAAVVHCGARLRRRPLWRQHPV